jgi:large subunit ribosomal protein L16
MSMLSPKRSKFRKSHKGNTKGFAKGGTEVSFGDYGLQVTSPGWLTARQIEAARVAISRSVKKLGKIYVRVFPDHPVTKKPAETRMGPVRAASRLVGCSPRSRVIFEVRACLEIAKEAFHRAHHKLP